MPNVRGKNQTLITCPMDSDLLREIDCARGRISRSQFVREALADKLRGLGLTVREDIVFPPDRVSVRAKVSGKGNSLKQVFKSASPVLASAKPYPKPKRGKKKPEK